MIAKWKARNLAIANSNLSCMVSLFAYNTYSHSLWGFKAQLLHVPDEVLKLELNAVHSLCKFPFCALGPCGAFHVHKLGLTSARPLAVMNLSALTRTANRTLHGWRYWHPLIIQSAEQNLSARTLANGFLSCDWWDSVPFACNLALYDCSSDHGFAHIVDIPAHNIPHGLAGSSPSLPKWIGKIKTLPALVKKQIAEVRTEPKMQKHVYNLLVPWVVGMSWASLIKQRLCDLSARNELLFEQFEAFKNFDFDALLAACSTCRPFVASHVLRTLTNGWVTTHRISAGKTLKHCIFGCTDKKDQLAHDGKCEKLCEHIRSIMGLSRNYSPWTYFGATLDSKMIHAVAFASFFLPRLPRSKF